MLLVVDWPPPQVTFRIRDWVRSTPNPISMGTQRSSLRSAGPCEEGRSRQPVPRSLPALSDPAFSSAVRLVRRAPWQIRAKKPEGWFVARRTKVREPVTASASHRHNEPVHSKVGSGTHRQAVIAAQAPDQRVHFALTRRRPGVRVPQRPPIYLRFPAVGHGCRPPCCHSCCQSGYATRARRAAIRHRPLQNLASILPVNSTAHREQVRWPRRRRIGFSAGRGVTVAAGADASASSFLSRRVSFWRSLAARCSGLRFG